MQIFTVGQEVRISSGEFGYTRTVSHVQANGKVIIVDNKLFEFNGRNFTDRAGYCSVSAATK